MADGTPPSTGLPGSGSVNNAGAYVYSVPIQVPPGTAGMAPSLALTYSSEGGDGFEGWGWSLSGLSAIARCPRTLSADGIHGSVNYDSNDRFCLDGQELMIATGTYGADGSTYNTQYQGFSEIIAHGTAGSGPAWFELHAKNGTVYQFGNTTASAVQATSKTSIRKWLVNQITDTKGNYLTVSYTETNGDAYPIEIDYTGNASASPAVTPYNSVKFGYGNRSDIPLSFQGGSWWKYAKLLSNIKTYNGSTLVQQYLLTYENGTTTAHSRLKTIQLCDAAGTKCLPTTTFTWQGGGMSTMNTPTGISTAQGHTLVSGDFNGDGLTDAAVVDTSCPSGGTIYSGSTAGTFSAAGMTTAYYYYTYSNDTQQYYSGPICFLAGTPQIGDLSGDGLSDIVSGETYWWLNGGDPESASFTNLLRNSGGTNFVQVARNYSLPSNLILGDFNGDGMQDGFAQTTSTSGNAWFGNGDGTFTQQAAQSGLGTSSTLYAGDFDGDGCTDLLAQGGSNSITYFCNPAVSSATVSSFSGSTIIPGDFNGDGKTDILVVNSSGATIYLSSGTGFWSSSYPVTSSSSWHNYKIVAGDWNGDGKTDVALISQTSGSNHLIFQSIGTDFVQITGDAISNTAGATTAVVADWNNDGADDLWLKSSSDQLVTFALQPEVITGIDNGAGAVTTVKYNWLNQNGTFYTKGTGATYSTQDLDGPYYLVSEIDAPNGIGGNYVTTYAYNGAKADVTAPPVPLPKWNLLTSGFLGFTKIVATDSQSGIVTTTNFNTALPYAGSVASQTAKSGSVTLYSATNTYAAVSQGGNSNFVYLQKSVVARSDLNGTAFPTVTTNYTPDAYGNMTTIATTVSDGSSQTVTNTYTNDTTNWILGEITESDVNSVVGSSNLTRHHSYTPDATSGITKQVVLESGNNTCNAGTSSCTLTAAIGLDAFGNRNGLTYSGSGIATRGSSIAYDGNGEFPTTATDALTNVTQLSYDPMFGGLLQVTDPNSVVSKQGFDTLGRLSSQTKPDGNLINFAYTWCTSLPTGESCPSHAVFDTIVTPTTSGGSQNGAIAITYYDALGRVIATDVQGFGGAWIRSSTIYDSSEHLSKTSRPYFLSGGTAEWTTYTNDTLGRPVTMAFPDSSSASYCYNGLATSVTNANSQITTTVKNAQGLVSEIVQVATAACGTSGNTSTYAYDAFGDPTSIFSNQTWTFTYDIRGRKVTSSTPDMGSWSYAYDVLDELTSQTDAKSQPTTLTWDKLMRLSTRTENDLYSKWVYDGATNGIGKLEFACTGTTCSAAPYWREQYYDTDGRLSQTLMVLDGGTHRHYTPSYDTNGRLATLTYPSGFEAQYVYDPTYGYLTQIQDQSTGTAIWTVNNRDAELHLVQGTAANGVITNNTFDPDTGRLLAICASTSTPCGGEIENQSYGWDPINNLLTRSDTINGWNETFCYDTFNRMTKYSLDGSTCTSGTDKKTMGYLSGNISSKSDICNTSGCMAYGAGTAGPHALTSIAATFNGQLDPTFSYDANGNMLGGASRSFTWTSFNMASQIVADGTTLGIAYGPEHQRYKMCLGGCTSPTGTTQYYYDPATGGASELYTTTSGTTWTDYIVGPDGQIVAERQKAGSSVSWLYLVGDHLGSTTSVTDSTGSTSTEESDSYDAWGKRRNADATDSANCSLTSETTRGYTGQEMLDSVCLINMNARLYDSQLGQFLSPDPTIPDPYNTLSYFPYSYTNNNPLNATDPTGYQDLTTGIKRIFCMSQCWNNCNNVGCGSSQDKTALDASCPGACTGSRVGYDNAGDLSDGGVAFGGGSFGEVAGYYAIGVQPVPSTDGIETNTFWGVWVPFNENFSWGQLSFGNNITFGTSYGGNGNGGWWAAATRFLTKLDNVTAPRPAIIPYMAGPEAGAIEAVAADVFQFQLLKEQLASESANSIFTDTGELTAKAINESAMTHAPGTLGNPEVPAGFGKFTTPTFQSPLGDFRVHFYMDPGTGEVFYDLDYKALFNRGIGQ